MPIYKVDGVKKDGLQKYNVRVNYISDRDGKPKQLTRAAYGSEAAKDLERQLLSEIKEKGENAFKRLTVGQLFEAFIAVKTHEVRESTVEKHRDNYRIYIEPTMADVQIDKVTIAAAQEWKLFIEQKELAIKTKQNIYSTFRAMFNFALKMEYLLRNPLSVVGNFKTVFQNKPELEIYTAQEFNQFIGIAKQQAQERQEIHRDMSEWEFYAFFNIAFYTGLRKGEIHALMWTDFDGEYLSIKRSITQKLGGEDRETPTKNKSSVRTIQLPRRLINVLNEHRARQEKMGRFTESYRICGGERCLRDSTIQNRHKHYAKLAKVKLIRIHDFRHSHASLLANEGINIQEIARRLGHARVEMTWNIYSHMYPREEEKAVDVLNKIA